MAPECIPKTNAVLIIGFIIVWKPDKWMTTEIPDELHYVCYFFKYYSHFFTFTTPIPLCRL